MRSRTLVVGLGNPLMGDDGIGSRVAEALAADPRLPEHVTVVAGGTDLLRLADTMRDRQHVVVLDAALDDREPGCLTRIDGPLDTFDSHGGHAHHLSAVQALALLREATDTLAGTRVTVLAISVSRAATAPDLSPALAGRVPALVDEILAIVAA